jgi:uncharacterized protein
MDKKRLEKIKRLVKIKDEYKEKKNLPSRKRKDNSYFGELAEYEPRNSDDDFPIGPEELVPIEEVQQSEDNAEIQKTDTSEKPEKDNIEIISADHERDSKNRTTSLLTHGSISVNTDCNLFCTYCYRPADNKKQSIPLAAGRSAVDFLFKNSGSTLSINFFGGEPLLAFDKIESLVLYGREKGARENKTVSFSLNTNGTVLNKRILLFLRQHRVGIVLSIDGPPEVHNHHRKQFDGKGSFQLLEKNIPMLLDEPQQVHVRMTVTPETVSRMFESTIFIYDLGFRSAAIAMDRGDERWDEEKKTIFREQYLKITEWYIEILKKNKVFKLVDLDFGAVSLSYPLSGKGLPCSAGLNGIAISTDGRIYPCYRFVGMREAEIGDIINGINEERRRHFTGISFHDTPECRNCELNYRCHRCPWLSHLKTGKFNTTLEINCFEGKVMLEMFRMLRDEMEGSNNQAYLKRKNAVEKRFFTKKTSP